MTRRIFVAGTDTGVGKTVVSAALIAHFRKNSRPVYYKPIQTGAVDKKGHWVSEDVEMVNALTGEHFTTERNCTYLLRAPMSPLQAAGKENRDIDIEWIMDDLGKLTDFYDMIIMEAAGGLMVPVTENLMMIDLIAKCDCEAVVVARPGLGTINHSLLTINLLKQQQVSVSGFVVCGYPQDPDVVVKENPQMIETFSGVKYLGSIPFCESQTELTSRLLDDLRFGSLKV